MKTGGFIRLHVHTGRTKALHCRSRQVLTLTLGHSGPHMQGNPGSSDIIHWVLPHRRCNMGTFPSVSADSPCRTGSGEAELGLDLQTHICSAWHSHSRQKVYNNKSLSLMYFTNTDTEESVSFHQPDGQRPTALPWPLRWKHRHKTATHFISMQHSMHWVLAIAFKSWTSHLNIKDKEEKENLAELEKQNVYMTFVLISPAEFREWLYRSGRCKWERKTQRTHGRATMKTQMD